MTLNGNFWICGRHDTPEFVSAETVAKPWYSKIAQDQELWQETAITSYPCVVAHEYWRMRQLLGDGQVFGALLQMKDLLETLLKFPLLVTAAGWIGYNYR